MGDIIDKTVDSAVKQILFFHSIGHQWTLTSILITVLWCWVRILKFD